MKVHVEEATGPNDKMHALFRVTVVHRSVKEASCTGLGANRDAPSYTVEKVVTHVKAVG